MRSDTKFADGSRDLQIYDWQDAKAWSSYINHYDTAGVFINREYVF
jgi:hypothetical protein